MLCSVCKKPVENSEHVVYRNEDYFSKENFEILYCKREKMAVTLTPDGFDVSPYYPVTYYGSNNKRFLFLIEYIIYIFRWLRASFISSVSRKNPGSVLDIGCGRGIMLSMLKKRGWKVTGTEYSDMSSDFSRKQLGSDIIISTNILAENIPAGFDVISLFHVMEHVPDPDAYFEFAKNKLVDNGILIVEVPNINSWQFQIAKGSWIYLDAPRHLFQFSPESLDTMAGRHSLRTIRKSTLSLEFGFFGMMESIYNVLLPQNNNLFHILRRGESKAKYTGHSFLTDIIVVILFIPVFIVSVVIESLAVMFGKGGVVRMVFEKGQV